MWNRTQLITKDGRAGRFSFERLIAVGVSAALMFVAPLVLAGNLTRNSDAQRQKKQKSATVAAPVGSLQGLPITELSETEAILHALNRLSYGPRPGDLEAVRQIGLAKWIDQQLNPDSIDDSAIQARLEKYPTLRMSSAKLYSEFPQPQQAAKKEGVSLEEYRKEQQAKQQQVNKQMTAMENAEQKDGLADGSMEDGGMDAGGKAKITKQGYNGGDPNRSPLEFYQQLKTPQRIVVELSMAKIDRAIYSERQLYEEMAAFWFNHFNVFAGKGADRWMLTAYERDTIRPHAMGKFEDLVVATAKSPAMMFYLDNWLNTDPGAEQRIAQQRRGRGGFGGFGGTPTTRPGQQQQQKREFGINENYGRELMELHTLGVDGGYTQQDVVEVAKCFTGWTIRRPQQDGEFFYNPLLHVNGAKRVLGHTIDAGGINDAMEVIHLLTHDPHTARHISQQIAQHFVSDNPSASLVGRMAQTFTSSDGDIKAVLHTMFYSPEFWSRDAYAVKIKSPFELVVSAARAVGANVDLPLPMMLWSARIGEPLYQCQPPTGYKDTADTWVNTGALLNRLNYSLTLAGNRLRGAHVDIATLVGGDAVNDPNRALDRAIKVLLNGDISAQTRSTLEKQLNDPQVIEAKLDDPIKKINVGTVAGLVLGAPEFQRR
jgi:uncharacterized protein (DUF1800 family)